MNFDQWNQALGDAFLDEGLNRPVYFSATEVELRRMNDRFHLGMVDPVEDLRAVLRPYSFLAFGNRHRRWEASRTKDLPPWLPFLAATTLIVDRQTERGSTAFYEPLSAFLGHPRRITQQDYESTFFAWWHALKRWLADEKRHGGESGFATWTTIPREGPRSIIGHPYTQVLLRREERRQLDDFLAEFDQLDADPPTARDRRAVAHQLVAALRWWARNRHSMSGRLRKILEEPEADETLSLGYVLLDRLFDDVSGDQRPETSAGVVQIVPAYDEYERAVQLVAIGPNWARPSGPVTVTHADDALREPGDVTTVGLQITNQLLCDGIEVGDDPVARLVASRRYLLAARDWALWCSVDGALPGEVLHILLDSGEADRFALDAISGVRGLPAGWVICGPLTLDRLPPRVAEAAAAASRPPVPRLRGGLKLQSKMYLLGGEPTLDLGGFEGDIAVDGRRHDADGDSVLLPGLELDVGEHKIEVGGFDLTFHTVQSLQEVDPHPTLGRDLAGIVKPIDHTADLVTGARLFPGIRPPFHRGLIPSVSSFVKLGMPGEIGIVRGPLLAEWARLVGLPHVAVEVHARSTHPGGDRLVKRPRWVAWQSCEGRWVVAAYAWGATKQDEDAPFNPSAWRRMCKQIGADPEVWLQSHEAEDRAVVLDRWHTYLDSQVEE